MSITRKKWKVKGRFTTGFEMEMFTLDRNGRVVYEGEQIIENSRKISPGIHVVHEAGKHMFEIGATPETSIRKSFSNIMLTLEKVWEVAERKNLLLYPYATYPGEFNPKITKSPWYSVLEKVWGRDKFKVAGLCNSFHFHYGISQKIFAQNKKVIVANQPRGQRQGFVSSYNFLIAADPATTTLMQSSPFIEGKFLAKDSRMLLYRGGENLNYESLSRITQNFKLFRGLQDYVQTVTEVIKLVEKRYDIFKSQLIYWGFDPKLIRKYARKMDIAWNPVKINKHGTYEQRGMDMNLPSYALGVSVLLHRALRRIVDENIRVVPSDIGIYTPFKIEKNELYIPPISVVKEQLQLLSATEGLASSKIYRYCRGLAAFALEKSDRSDRKLVSRIKEMMDTRKTMSDRLLADIGKLGETDSVDRDAAASFAEKWSYDFLDDMDYTKKLLK
jgi:hypothetical protein